MFLSRISGIGEAGCQMWLRPRNLSLSFNSSSIRDNDYQHVLLIQDSHKQRSIPGISIHVGRELDDNHYRLFRTTVYFQGVSPVCSHIAAFLLYIAEVPIVSMSAIRTMLLAITYTSISLVPMQGIFLILWVLMRLRDSACPRKIKPPWFNMV